MHSHNEIYLDNFIMRPVRDFSIFTGFSCLSSEDTDRDLEHFIIEDAQKHYDDKIAVTYGLFHEDNDTFPVGFATLQNDAINVENCKEEFPNLAQYDYKWFPAVKLGRFAIHNAHQKNKVGSLFLGMIIQLMNTDNRTGCRFITVDARRDKKNKVDVRPFYEKNFFCEFNNKVRGKTSHYVPMFLDLLAIESE